MTPDDPAATLLPLLLSLVGPHTAKVITAIAGWAIFAGWLAQIFLALAGPPPAGGWLAKVWEVLRIVAGAVKYLKPAYRPGATAAMVPTEHVGVVRTEVAAKLDIPREETKP